MASPNDDSSASGADSYLEPKTQDVPSVEGGDKAKEGEPKSYEKLERLKREKRLAMNRECARARRRRKKLRLELLEGRVQDITSKNQKLQETNDALRTRMAQLEAELMAAKSTIAMVSGGAMGGAQMGDGGAFFGGMGGPMGMNGMQGMNGAAGMQDFLLQRRAALAGLGGGAAGLGGIPGGNDAFRMMQFMEAKQQQQQQQQQQHGNREPSANGGGGGGGSQGGGGGPMSNNAGGEDSVKNSFMAGRNPFMNGGNANELFH